MLFLLLFGTPIAGCPTEKHTEYWRYAGTVRSLFVREVRTDASLVSYMPLVRIARAAAVVDA